MITTLQAIFRALTDAVTPWIVLAPWEAGVRLRLGKHVTVLTPGFNWRIPGIDRISVQTTRLRVAAMPLQTLSTRDGRTLIVGGNVSYSIEKILLLYDSLHHPEDTIRAIAQEVVSEVVLANTSVTPEMLTEVASDKLATRLKGYGLAEITVCLTDFAFVRTYRIVNDQRWGNSGDALITTVGRPQS